MEIKFKEDIAVLSNSKLKNGLDEGPKTVEGRRIIKPIKEKDIPIKVNETPDFKIVAVNTIFKNKPAFKIQVLDLYTHDLHVKQTIFTFKPNRVKAIIEDLVKDYGRKKIIVDNKTVIDNNSTT